MCRLFGFRTSVVSRAHRSLVAADNALAEQARAHPHGWGIGYFQGADAYLVKSDGPAADCSSFRRAADRLASDALIAHVRRATVGQVDTFNTHPFRNGRWIFAHNGTIAGFAAIEPWLQADTPAPLWQRRLGTTDSEAFFLNLLGHLEAAGVDPEGNGAASGAAVAAVVRGRMAALRARATAAGEAAPIVNFLLSNGRTFFAHRAGRELWFATQKYHCRDALTCAEVHKPCLEAVRPVGRVNHLLVASERIGDEDHWEEVADDTLVELDATFHLHHHRT